MCCLFGFYNYSGKDIENIDFLTNNLAEHATIRGTDATGIAYMNKNKLVIHKEPKSAFDVTFRHPDNTVCVTGHTRHATQGNEKFNYNNHPFKGNCRNLRFALCHNGILSNDFSLRNKYHLPKTKVETDSYIAVQLLERSKNLHVKSVKDMAEKINGSYAFSILDTSNTLWLIRGDSPLSLIHLPKYKLYIYASTDSILYKSLVDTKLFNEIKSGNFEEIDIKSGDILSITTDGKIHTDKFDYKDYFARYNWWDFGYSKPHTSYSSSYIDDLKAVASYQGYSEDEIDELLENGFSPEEIEEYIYCME